MHFNLKEVSLQKLLKNLYFLARQDVKERLIEQRLAQTYNSILIHSAIDAAYRQQYAPEIERLKGIGQCTLYPSQDIHLREVEAAMDGARRMPYVMHNGKRLYYPKSYTVAEAIHAYHNIVDSDGILGTSSPGTPHQYQDETYRLNDGDVVVDVGCAEALFALDNIERVSKAILIECNAEWLTALRATFAPYSDKVEIVNRLVTNHDSRSTIRLSTLLQGETRPVFIKMDIEGYEVATVQSAAQFLSGMANVTLACCTYHNSADGEQLAAIFDAIGYEHRFSDGYMIFARYDQPRFPFFRHAVIRARKRK